MGSLVGARRRSVRGRGQVAANRRDLSLGNLETSDGIGFRVHSNSAFAARLDLAFSREGFIPLLRFEHVF